MSNKKQDPNKGPDLSELLAEKAGDIPAWARITIGVISIFAIFKLTPILELLAVFAQIVMIPLAFFAAVGLISTAGIEAVANHYKSLVGKVTEVAEAKISQSRKAA